MNVPQAASVWTDERVVQLRSLWADGLSCSQIAAAMGEGLTRNAVIGKIHRLGMGEKAHPLRKARAPKPRREPVFISREEKARRQAIRGVARLIGWDIPTFEPQPPAESLHVSLLDLGPNSCRYPEGDGPFLFCGQPRMLGSSYCEHCHKVTHQSPVVKKATQHPRIYGWRAA